MSGAAPAAAGAGAAGPRRFIKPGTVVLCLRGRQAGKKAVVLKVHEAGLGNKKFPLATVVGIQRPPRQVKRGMSQKKIKKKLKVGVFFKHVNYSHFMPTRYSFQNAVQMVNATEVEDLLKKSATPKDRKEKRRAIGNELREYVSKNTTAGDKAASVKWFMSKLYF